MSIFSLLQPNYMRQPPAWFHSRVLVGAGAMLTPRFVNQYNISHVINCAFPEDSPHWFRDQNASRYTCLEAVDSLETNILNWYPKFERTMHQFLRETTNGVVYVHCQAGINRSGFLALTYVAKNFDVDLDQLVLSVKRQRPCMLTNQVFTKQTKEFINGCIQSEKNKRNLSERTDWGDSGFTAPRNSPEPEGFQDNASGVTTGVAKFA